VCEREKGKSERKIGKCVRERRKRVYESEMGKSERECGNAGRRGGRLSE
jgi:hypothetical protein